MEASTVTKPIKFTAVFRKVPEGYIGFVEELPGANTQGATLDETRRNLEEAIDLVLEANRALAEEDLVGQEVIREAISVAS
jgi:predicted RNase H-like HicB family nuclease